MRRGAWTGRGAFWIAGAYAAATSCAAPTPESIGRAAQPITVSAATELTTAAIDRGCACTEANETPRPYGAGALAIAAIALRKRRRRRR